MDRLELGRIGEVLAARHLESAGWTIEARNLRLGRGEVDLVARRGHVLAFVEVKTRRSMAFGHPFEAITAQKRLEIAEVARRWLRERRLPRGTLVRFDAVAVAPGAWGNWVVEHLPDAWRME